MAVVHIDPGEPGAFTNDRARDNQLTVTGKAKTEPEGEATSVFDVLVGSDVHVGLAGKCRRDETLLPRLQRLPETERRRRRQACRRGKVQNDDPHNDK